MRPHVSSKKRTRLKNGEIKKIILRTVLSAGIVGLAMTSPLIAKKILAIYGKHKRKYHPKYYASATIADMCKKGLIEMKNEHLLLTSRGEAVLDKYRLEENSLQKRNKKWDGKWRVVVFDIKERFRNIRNKVRSELQSFGFRKLQHSVWITPYDCDDLIALLKIDMRIAEDVEYMLVETLESEERFKIMFNL